MASCAYMNCLGSVSGLTLVCEMHVRLRKQECSEMRNNPNFKPVNLMCTLPSHLNIPNCACHTRAYSGGECQPCVKCHFCNEVHPMSLPIAA